MQDAHEPSEHAANDKVAEEKPQASKTARGKCCTLPGLMPALLASIVHVQLSVMTQGYATVLAASLIAKLRMIASTANNRARHGNAQDSACFIVAYL